MENQNMITDEDKARQLHLLFKNEIPAMLSYMQEEYQNLSENEKDYRSVWNSMINFDSWLLFARDTNEIIVQERDCLLNDPFYFSERLLFNHTAFFVKDCFVDYANSRTQNVMFKNTVNHFFKKFI